MSLWNTTFSPMLLKEIDKPFDSNEYLYEIKYDGIRAIIYASNKTFKIISRNNKDLTYLFPELKEIQKLVTKPTIFDGEIISLINNKISFKNLQTRIHIKDKKKINMLAKSNPVIYACFDILYLDKDLIDLPLIKRKKLLESIKDNDVFFKTKYYLKDGIKLFTKIKKLNIEGIVAKKIDSTYEINQRSNNWLKIKNIHVDNFYIGGYIYKKNNYISLLLGFFVDNLLIYVGSATLSKNKALYKIVLKEKKINSSPFSNFNKSDVTYLKPKLMCRVKYLEKTSNNMLRHPVIEEL
jgi:ATP-dependent DNA ligase